MTPPLLATEFDPVLPGVLEPGAAWRGRFAGPGRIPAGSYIAVAFGRFTTYEQPPAGLPDRLMAVTRAVARVD